MIAAGRRRKKSTLLYAIARPRASTLSATADWVVPARELRDRADHAAEAARECLQDAEQGDRPREGDDERLEDHLEEVVVGPRDEVRRADHAEVAGACLRGGHRGAGPSGDGRGW